MPETLALKHKNSLALNKKLLRESCKSERYEQSLPFQLILFPIFTCCIFAFYWFVLCPLLFNFFYNREKYGKHWPASWPFLYWLIAFLIWLLIMAILIAIWRNFRSKYNSNKNAESYGSGGAVGPSCFTNAKQVHPERIKLHNVQKRDISSDSDFDTKKTKNAEGRDPNGTKSVIEDSPNDRKKQKNLPPLVIHRRMSGNDVENTGIVNVEERADENEENAETIALQNEETNIANRESMKNYLKLVTVTPMTEEDDVLKSPKGPLSPRELFFIDLIREAEKAESNKTNQSVKPTENKHFFPNDFSAPEKPSTLKSAENEGENSDGKSTYQAEHESSYFIANIESPLSEKTEVFLEIQPESETSKEWTLDTCKEKPILVLRQGSEVKEEKTTEERITVFEV